MDVTVRYSLGGTMTIHLEELERSTSKKEKDQYNGGYYTVVSISQCRRLLRLILMHAEREDIQRVDNWMTECTNEKVRRIWDAESGRFGIKT